MCLIGMVVLADVSVGNPVTFRQQLIGPTEKQTDCTGVHVTAWALLTCKTSEGKEFSHMFCHEGHVSRTLLLFREILVCRAPTAEVSSAGMTWHTPTSKTRQEVH